MTVLAEAMAAQAGLVKDPSGNLVYPEQLAAAAPAEPTPAKAATTSTPATTTAPTASVPEPPVVGQSAAVDRTEVKKKTLLGG